MATPHDFYIRVLGTAFRIRAEDAQWRLLLEEMWSPFASPEAGARALELSVEGQNGGWNVTVPDKSPIHSSDPWEVLSLVRIGVIHSALTRARGIVGLHAACVQRGETSVLLVGAAGAGKSTLTVELLKRGWAYLGDDFTPISVDTTTVRPFPKPVHLKAVESWPGYREIWSAPAWLPAPTWDFLIPARAFPRVADPRQCDARATHVFLPKFSRGAHAEMRSLSPALCAARCGEHLFWLHREDKLTAPKLEMLLRLCRAATRAEIEYGSSPEGADLVEEVVKTPPPDHP